MRKCSKQRKPFDHLTHKSKVERNMRREIGGRTLLPSRSLSALGCEVRNTARTAWRNWEWCMSRVCNSQYQR